jgi:aspartokinase
MMRRNVRTETLTCDGLPAQDTPGFVETAFEKQRGVNRIERRDGFCQVHVSELGAPLMDNRLVVLKAVAESGISLDFLKLSPSGLSFLVPQTDRAAIEETLTQVGVKFSLRPERSIVMVHAVNMRDEEGLIAEIVQSAIASEAQIDHIGDGHDRLLLVASSDSVEKIISRFARTQGLKVKPGKVPKSA